MVRNFRWDGRSECIRKLQVLTLKNTVVMLFGMGIERILCLNMGLKIYVCFLKTTFVF